MPLRFCAACCEYYDINLFYRQPENTDGWAYFCKMCSRDRKKRQPSYGRRKTPRQIHFSCYTPESQTPSPPPAQTPESQTPPDFTVVLD